MSSILEKRNFHVILYISGGNYEIWRERKYRKTCGNVFSGNVHCYGNSVMMELM